MSSHFWPLNKFMLLHRETIPINGNKENKKNEHHNCRNRDNVYHTENTWFQAYKLQVYLEEKQPFFTFQFSFFISVHGLHNCFSAFILMLFQYRAKR